MNGGTLFDQTYHRKSPFVCRVHAKNPHDYEKSLKDLDSDEIGVAL
jgi:hypothetical protein